MGAPYYLLFRFIDGRGFISRAITLDTNSLFDHTELGVLEDATDWKKGVSGWLGAHAKGGVEIRKPDYCTPFRDYRYAVPVTQDAYNKAMTFAHAQVGVKYDLSDIAGLLLRVRRFHSPSREICSELMLQVAQAAGLNPLNVDPPYAYLVTPDMFHLSPIFIGRRVLAKGEPK